MRTTKLVMMLCLWFSMASARMKASVLQSGSTCPCCSSVASVARFSAGGALV